MSAEAKRIVAALEALEPDEMRRLLIQVPPAHIPDAGRGMAGLGA